MKQNLDEGSEDHPTAHSLVGSPSFPGDMGVGHTVGTVQRVI